MVLAAETPLNLNDLVEQLFLDGIINKQQMSTIAIKGRHSANSNSVKKHPVAIIAEAGINSAKSPDTRLTVDWLTEWLSMHENMDYYRIDPLKIDVRSITAVMSKGFARRHNIIAVAVDDTAITIAVSEPRLSAWVTGLEQATRKVIKRVLASPVAITHFIEEFYKLSDSVYGAAQDAGEMDKITNLEQLVSVGDTGEFDANDQHIIKIVDWLLQYAYEQRASDIHIEPRRGHSRLRFRIDGILHKVYEFPAKITAAVTARLKIMARMDVAEKRRPLDGRIKTRMPDSSEVELRISTMPTAFGEKLVARIFDPGLLLSKFSELGFSSKEELHWRQLINQKTGIVLLTGPTGSGKTTTLYTSLKVLAKPEVNVCTVEDPVEMVEPSFNQMQVQADIDLTFASGMRALLRQDPDIIMVGEIRDRETAEMAIQAALTGHLVISTLHTNDAPSAITRLIEIGVPAYLINATLLGVMAQRLVRVLCSCKAKVEVSDEEWQSLAAPQVPKPDFVYRPRGCESCRQTGFKGRIGLYEMLRVSNSIRQLVKKESDVAVLRAQALREGMHVLRMSGARQVVAGVTTIEEVLRVSPVFEED